VVAVEKNKMHRLEEPPWITGQPGRRTSRLLTRKVVLILWMRFEDQFLAARFCSYRNLVSLFLVLVLEFQNKFKTGNLHEKYHIFIKW